MEVARTHSLHTKHPPCPKYTIRLVPWHAIPNLHAQERGHCPSAEAEQAQRFIHAQVNVYKHDLLEPLAAKLAQLAPGAIDTFFFANSGALARARPTTKRISPTKNKATPKSYTIIGT